MGINFVALTEPNALGKEPKYPSKRFERSLKNGIDLLEEWEHLIAPPSGWREGLVFRRRKKNGTVSQCHGFGYDRKDRDTPDDRVAFVFRFKAYGVREFEYQDGKFEFIPPIPEVSQMFECGPFITPEKAGQGGSKKKPAKQDHRKSTKSKKTGARLWRQLKKEFR